MTTNNQTNEQLAGDRAELIRKLRTIRSPYAGQAAAMLEADAQRPKPILHINRDHEVFSVVSDEQVVVLLQDAIKRVNERNDWPAEGVQRQAMKPLTDEQLDSIWFNSNPTNFEFKSAARAVITEFCRINNLDAQPAADDKAGVEPVYQAQYIGDRWTDVDAQEYERLQGSPTIASRKFYTRPQPQAIPAGYAIVPVEPTPEIRDAICYAKNMTKRGGTALMSDVELDSIYRAMIAAAPKSI